MVRASIPLIAALVACAGLTATTAAQNASLPTPADLPPVTQQSGAWLVCVKSYAGDNAMRMAHSLARHVRSVAPRLPIYVYKRGGEELAAEKARLQQIRDTQTKWMQEMGFTEMIGKPRIKTYQTRQEQYAVLVGGWPDMEAARNDLEKIRKLPPPKDVTLMDLGVIERGDANGSRLERAPINPFTQAFVVPNPTIERPKEEDKPDPIIKELNEGEELSLLQVRKPFTLVVRVYQGQMLIQSYSPEAKNESFLTKIGLGKKERTALGAAGEQAIQLAKYLRSLKEYPVDAYVLHTRYSSIVCVGGFDSKDDPKLKELQRVLSGLKVQQGTVVLDQLMNPPLPMPIPRF